MIASWTQLIGMSLLLLHTGIARGGVKRFGLRRDFYRFGHTLISKEFTMKTVRDVKTTFGLKDAFFNGSMTRNLNRRPWWL